MIATPAVLPTSIPSPAEGSWDIGGFELRAYALCIMAGIVLAIWLGNKRWLARGGEPGVVADVAVWAVPFGIIGGRLYHVITDNQLYFREGQDPWQALRIWEGGLGIWGAIAMGGLGVWIGCRRRGVPMPAMADTLAPGILLAQAVGRWGNWFNQELFGRPTDLPWGLEIDPAHRPADYADVATFHPTFLYESLWAVAVAFLLLWADRRFTLGHGRVFALYVAGYTLGRGFWEYLRIDPANEIFGVRVNLWVSGLIFVAAIGFFVWSLRNRPGREDPDSLRGFYDQDDPFSESSKDKKDDAEVAPFSLPDDDDDESDAAKAEVAEPGSEVKTDAATDDPVAVKDDAAEPDAKAADEVKVADAAESDAPEADAPEPEVLPDAAEADEGKAHDAPESEVKADDAAKKAAPANVAAKKAATKNTATKKTAAKKTAAKNTAAKKAAPRKTTAKKSAPPAESGAGDDLPTPDAAEPVGDASANSETAPDEESAPRR